MASKSSKGNKNSQVQSSVAERRLRPIYDWLDNGNNKKALQEADKVLKKQPNFDCCKALKSLALIRLSREDDASPLLDSILEQGTTDEGALQAMNIAYRELHQTHMICTMYEKATKLEPVNEELLSQLFMSYVRIGAYKKQQAAAMALYKLKAKTPYYFWAVMSVVLQAKSSNDEKTANAVILPLAERMIAKIEKDGKIDQEQETRLYLMVLEMQQKYSQALGVLEGTLGQKLESTTSFLNFIINSKLNYQKKLEHWDQVNILAKDILHKNPDQWIVYLDYITSILRLVDIADPNVAECVDSTVPQAVNFITYQKDTNPKCRGPYLAQIELHSRLLARREKDVHISEMTELLVAYFMKFGDKPCCGGDLKLYLPILDASEADKFFVQTLNSINFDETKDDTNNPLPKTDADISRHVCWHAMTRIVGRHHNCSLTEREKTANELINLHKSCSQHFNDYSSTITRPYDNYLVLAGHVLWELWHETSEDKYFWTAIVNLDQALNQSPASYFLRFVLIKFLNQSGAVEVSDSIHSGLELKHVQLDSLGYVLSRHIQTCGHFHSTIGLFSSTLKFFNSNYKDIIDFLISAYRCGSFDKIIEFINLRQRLSSSQQFALVNVEKTLVELLVESSSHGQALQIMTAHQIDPEKDEIPWVELIDNRDFKVMVSWDPQDKCGVTDDLISESFMQDQKFLKYRSLILRCVAACLFLAEDIQPSMIRSHNQNHTKQGDVTITENGSGSTASSMEQVLRSLVAKLQAHNEEVMENEANYKALESPIQGPDRSRLTLFVESDHCALLMELFRAVLEAQKCGIGGGSDSDSLINCLTKAFKLFCQMAELVIKSSSHLLKNREELFEKLVSIIESGNIFAIVCGACQRLIEPNLPKKSKKRPQIQTQNEQLIALDKIIHNVGDQLQSLLDFFKEFENDNIKSLTEQFSDTDMNDSSKGELKSSIEESYSKTFMNFNNVVKSKIEYLKALRL